MKLIWIFGENCGGQWKDQIFVCSLQMQEIH